MIEVETLDFSKYYKTFQENKLGLEDKYFFVFENEKLDIPFGLKTFVPSRELTGDWICKRVESNDELTCIFELAPVFVNERFFKYVINMREDLAQRFEKDFEQRKMYIAEASVHAEEVYYTAISDGRKQK